jgi:hypothetical protein
MNNLPTTYGEDETTAVRDIWDAATLGIVKICGNVCDDEGNLGAEDQAACDRLQKVLTVLDGTYPHELLNRLIDEAIHRLS